MPIHPIITEMARTGRVLGEDGKEYRYHSGVSAAAGEALYRLAAALPPGARALEIGMASGTSSLQLLYGMEAGGGTLLTVDPGERRAYGGAGLANVRAAGYQGRFAFREEPSFLALPALVAAKESFDLVFIDGHHTFDYTFVDYFYSDLLLREGGYLLFHDVQMWSVSKVARFLRTHKEYSFLPGFSVPCTPAQRVRRYLGRLAQPWAWLRGGRRREGECQDGKGTVAVPLPAWGVREPMSFPHEMQAYRKTRHREVFWNEYHEF
jgi:predicted O-methyltransferase YrrM